jgi:hypothetical protein
MPNVYFLMFMEKWLVRDCRRSRGPGKPRLPLPSDMVTHAEKWFNRVHPGKPVSPLGHGQNARTTGGAGILPAAFLQRGSAVFLASQDVCA